MVFTYHNYITDVFERRLKKSEMERKILKLKFNSLKRLYLLVKV